LADGCKEWWVDGKRHRTDGPAIEWANGNKAWWVNGKRHRTDGPAIEYANGTKEWWVNGKRHRTDGPAIEYADGDKEWYVDGKRHRTDGPAIERANGSKYWFVDGRELTEAQFNRRRQASLKLAWEPELPQDSRDLLAPLTTCKPLSWVAVKSTPWYRLTQEQAKALESLPLIDIRDLGVRGWPLQAWDVEHNPDVPTEFITEGNSNSIYYVNTEGSPYCRYIAHIIQMPPDFGEGAWKNASLQKHAWEPDEITVKDMPSRVKPFQSWVVLGGDQILYLGASAKCSMRSMISPGIKNLKQLIFDTAELRWDGKYPSKPPTHQAQLVMRADELVGLDHEDWRVYKKKRYASLEKHAWEMEPLPNTGSFSVSDDVPSLFQPFIYQLQAINRGPWDIYTYKGFGGVKVDAMLKAPRKEFAYIVTMVAVSPTQWSVNVGSYTVKAVEPDREVGRGLTVAFDTFEEALEWFQGWLTQIAEGPYAEDMKKVGVQKPLALE
jgi:hypothetical protein